MACFSTPGRAEKREGGSRRKELLKDRENSFPQIHIRQMPTGSVYSSTDRSINKYQTSERRDEHRIVYGSLERISQQHCWRTETRRQMSLSKELMTKISVRSMNVSQKDTEFEHLHQHSKEFLHLQTDRVNRKSTLDLW